MVIKKYRRKDKIGINKVMILLTLLIIADGFPSP